MEETTHPTREKLEALVEGSLPDEDVIGLSRHISGCARCYEAVGAAARASREMPEPEWPLVPAFATAIGFAIALTLSLLYLLERLP